jgi:ABC-2 type transport system ATP-binding protein
MSIPGRNTLEVSFSHVPPGWMEHLGTLPFVEGAAGEGTIVRLQTTNGPETTRALLDAAAAASVTVGSLSVQSTTLDDVFVHYTGRDLRDALQEAAPRDSSFMIRRQ